MKTALITGVNGQLGSTLAEYLIEKDYQVVGTMRRSSNPDLSNLEVLKERTDDFCLEEMDICDSGSINRLISQYKPDEFYNTCAQSHVHTSWQEPVVTFDINATGVVRCLEAIRLFSPRTKFYQSSTSECYGDVLTETQNEDTELRPRSPYGASKVAAEAAVKVYRDSYHLFACFSRNFNFEGPRRGKQFVTRKITDAIGSMWSIVDNNIEKFIPKGQFISAQDAFTLMLNEGLIKPIVLGNLEARRDWSHVHDIANGIWLMMQEHKPETYVFGSGKTRSIKDFLSTSFSHVGVTNWANFVTIDAKFIRPAEVNYLCADTTKAQKNLDWKPLITFDNLVDEMVGADIKRYSNVR